MLRVMCAVESISVPSQSKTIRSNCSLAMRCRLRGGPISSFIELRDEAAAFGGHWRLELQRRAGGRMRELKPVRVQEHAFQTRSGVGARQRLVQRKVSVFGIAHD